MGLFMFVSRMLREYPLRTNLCLSTLVGFCGDIVCQSVYEPVTDSRPPLHRSLLPPESAASRLLVEVRSPSLTAQKWWRERCEEGAVAVATTEGTAAAEAATKGDGSLVPRTFAEKMDTVVLVDLRRSFVFCSFTFFFGVPFFLKVYHVLDHFIVPHNITKKQAIMKGFLSFIAAQVTNPLFISYVTAVDHFWINRDGRDGRRRTSPDPSHSTAGGNEQASVLVGSNHYRYESDTSFNAEEYWACVSQDVGYKLRHDFPDIVRYALVFWGCNWLPMFYYIPSHFRLFYSSCLQVVWSGIMSHLMHRAKRHHVN